MRILAIDPSSKAHNGLAIWDGDAFTVKVTDHARIFDAMDTEIFMGTTVYCETVQSYGMAVGREVFETCFWIGEFRRHCKALGLRFVHCYRSDIKMHLCKSTRAKDGNVRQALIDRWGVQGTKKAPGPTYGIAGDGWAALAVLTYAIDLEDTEQ